MRQVAAILIIIPFLLFCALPVGAVEKEERKWQDESVYSIVVDRFMNGNVDNDYNVDTNDPKAYHGGDIQGIIEQLDYIKKMGFTSILLTPIMDNGEKGYHGYWVKDFMAVEENFGTMADVKKLVEEAHKRDMKVIFDFVVNHTAKQHPWLNDNRKADWYHNEGSNDQEQLENERLSADLPNLNTANPDVRQYLFDVAEYWIEETNVDGFRLKEVEYVPKEFWRSFSTHVGSVKEEFFLLGQVSSDDPSSIADYETTGIDGFVNSPFSHVAREVFKEAGQPLDSLYSVWERSEELYQSPYYLGNFLGNMESPRFTHLSVQERHNPITRLKLGLTYLFTSPGIPIMYYGTEVPFDGGDAPANREMMNFKAGDEKLAQRIENLTAIRGKYPAITRGDFKELHNGGGLAIFKRTYQGQTMIIAINNSAKTMVAGIEDLADGQQLTGLLHDGLIRQQSDGTYRIGMERETADVFLVEEDKGYNWLFIGFILGVVGLFVTGIIMISVKNKRFQQS